MTIERAKALFNEWKREEFSKLRLTILVLAYQRGEFHADMLTEVPLSQRNMIGANVNALVKSRLLVSTGEHRKGASEASHGRRSYVYELTPEGIAFARLVAYNAETFESSPPDERLF